MLCILPLISWAPSATDFAADAIVVVLLRLKVARSLSGHCSLRRVGGLGSSCHFECDPVLLVLTSPLVPKPAALPWTGPADKEVLDCRGACIFCLSCSVLSLNLISSEYVEEWRWLGD